VKGKWFFVLLNMEAADEILLNLQST